MRKEDWQENKVGWVWANGQPMKEEEINSILRLREAGCKCSLPLLGETNNGPICRLCNMEV